MRIKKYRTFVGDFETTVYDKQEITEVWASASVELFTEDVQVFTSIQEQFDYLVSLKSNIIIYYHNLKFDGNFWLSFLMCDMQYEQALVKPDNKLDGAYWLNEKDMKNKTFKYSISDRGQWYTIIIKVNNIFIEIRDSLKLLPFSVDRIGKAFKTKHQKTSIEYTGFRYAGGYISDEEKEYIKNDVLVVKEALEIMQTEGHDKLTIGSCCLDEFKKTYSKQDFEMFFPDLYKIDLDSNEYGSPNVGEYIRKSYKGGWCYLVKGKENKIYHNGSTADVNSLYPSMMSSESGNRYPVGKPKFWKGNYIPDKALAENKYFFIRIRTRFYIKKDKLPFIQIKNSFMYKGTEALETSDFYNRLDGKYYKYYEDKNGNVVPTLVTLTLTMTDYYLLLEHYELVDFEILDGCYFFSEIGLFDEYIEKYKVLKQNSVGALRELAKLFLNNLYGKMASSKDSSFKVAYLKDNGVIAFLPVTANDKQAGYIPCGSAITSYARNFTIRVAQKNYHGLNKRGFIYADTDSIHCDLNPDEIVGVKVHDKDFCCWKMEAQWDEAIFTRQKTYIEHVTHEDLVKIDTPYYNIKCAGMPKRCKDLFEISVTKELEELDLSEFNEEEQKFLKTKRDLNSFKVGLCVPSKLRPKRIKGGIVLLTTSYEMR